MRLGRCCLKARQIRGCVLSLCISKMHSALGMIWPTRSKCGLKPANFSRALAFLAQSERGYGVQVTEAKNVDSFVPTAVTLVTMTIAMRLAISAYSIAAHRGRRRQSP